MRGRPPQEAQLHMARPLLFLGTLLADLALSLLGRQVVLSGLLTVRIVHSQTLHYCPLGMCTLQIRQFPMHIGALPGLHSVTKG